MKKVNRKIVDYINREWISQSKSLYSFAMEHNLDEKTVRNMKNDPDYMISFATLNKICEARSIKLSEFLHSVNL